MSLPDRFIRNMTELLGEDYPAWRDSLLCVPNTGIRVNELKITKDRFSDLWEKCGGESLEKIPWIHNGFFTKNTAEFSGHPLYQTGLFYIQEPSAMAPAENLPISPGDYVLDLCAAPGGKSTELLAKLGGTGLLHSNDISASRAQALRKNLELAGAANAFVTAESPDKLAACFHGFFDKILVDAPCSGEGMFRREPGMSTYWEEKGPAYYAPLQADILSAAVTMLKCGGCLMYSTCTFSPLENEANVLALLERFPELQLLEIPEQEGFCHGVLPGTEKCVRIYPHKMRGEGQFMALFVKRIFTDGQTAENRAVKEIMRNGCLSAIPENGYSSAIAGKKTASVKRYIYEKNDEIYLIPNGFRPYPSLRYLMTGLHLATRKKDRVLPSQALAEALFEGEWGRELSMAYDDIRVMKYLRGETLSASEEEIATHEPALTRLLGDIDPAVLSSSSAGGGRTIRDKKNDKSKKDKNILILIEGFPVGFGSFDRGLIKNKRAPGRRLL